MADQTMDILQAVTVSLGAGPTTVSVVLDAECATAVDDATPYPGDVRTVEPAPVVLSGGTITVAGDAGPMTIPVAPGPATAGGSVVTTVDGPPGPTTVGVGPGDLSVASGNITVDGAGAVESALVVSHVDVAVGDHPAAATFELALPVGAPTTIPGPATVAVIGGQLSVAEPSTLQLSPPGPQVSYTVEPELSPSLARWDVLASDPAITAEIGRAAAELGVEPQLVTRLVSQHSGWMASPGYGVEEFRERLWGELAGFPEEQRTKAHTAIDAAMTVALQQMFQKKVLNVPAPVAAPMTPEDALADLERDEMKRRLANEGSSDANPMFGDWIQDLGLDKAAVKARLQEESRLDVDPAFGDWMVEAGLTKADLQAKLEE